MEDTFKVVVVVDVQNCFMYTSDDQNAHFLNLGFKSDTSNESKAIAKEISDLINYRVNPNAVVFTRDFHPVNHISFEDEGRSIEMQPGTIWPKHCRNRAVACKPRLNGANEIPESAKPANPIKLEQLSTHPYNLNLTTIEDNLKYAVSGDDSVKAVNDILCYGTDISYYFFETDLAVPVYKLNKGNKDGRYKIGLASTKIENGNLRITNSNDEDKIVSGNEFTHKGRKYISLTKGEKCNQESYSAFNYHIEYTAENPSNPVKGSLPPEKKHSTGLWEWILANKGNATNIEITVCGLVGNVCVLFSVVQGMAMWDLVYQSSNRKNREINVTFNYSFMGNRFTSALPPSNTKPDAVANFNWDNTDLGFMHMHDYYYGNIPLKWWENEYGLYTNKFNVLDYQGTNIGVHTIPTKPPSGGRRRTRRMRSVCRRHRLDLNGVCRICSKYCKQSRRRRYRKNKKSRKY